MYYSTIAFISLSNVGHGHSSDGLYSVLLLVKQINQNGLMLFQIPNSKQGHIQGKLVSVQNNGEFKINKFE